MKNDCVPRAQALTKVNCETWRTRLPAATSAIQSIHAHTGSLCLDKGSEKNFSEKLGYTTQFLVVMATLEVSLLCGVTFSRRTDCLRLIQEH